MLLLVVGSTDVDTAIITLGGFSRPRSSPLLAAIAIAGTVIANMAVKIGDHARLTRAARACPAVLAMSASVVALLVMIGLAALRL